MSTVRTFAKHALRPLTLAVGLSFVSGVATAADGHRSEHVGLLSGIVVGALVGGPPGAVIGAVGGGLAGRSAEKERRLEQRDAEIARLQDELEQAQTRRAAAQEQLERRELIASTAAVGVAPRLPALALESSVQFRTGSAELEPHYAGQLRELARFAGRYPDARVHLRGYADTRGSASANQTLSAARVQAVRAALIAGGMAAQRISEQALGESQPLYDDGDREGRDFERRVLIRIESGQVQS